MGGQEAAPGVGFSSGGAGGSSAPPAVPVPPVCHWGDTAHPPPRNPPMFLVPFPYTKGNHQFSPVTPHTSPCVHTRVLPMAELSPLGGCRDPPCSPQTRVLLALRPFKPHQEPQVLGQDGDTGLGVPVPSALAAGCTRQAMVWLPVKPVTPALPPALPHRCWGTARPRGPARQALELDADPCCSAGCGLYP